MNAHYLKVALLHKLRFMQKVPYLATEVGYFSADVAAITGGKLIEFETKISMADFRADFAKEKHKIYRGLHQGEVGYPHWSKTPTWVPHQFYFVVPESLAPKVQPHLLSYPEYGLIMVREVSNQFLLRKAPVTVTRPKTLHKREIPQSVYQQFLFRMGSELASLSALKLRKEEAE